MNTVNTARLVMDRRLKERLVGATILVALIVLIVPELLSGPKRPALPPLAAGLATRTVSVDLATSKAVAAPQSETLPAAPAEASSAEPQTEAPSPSTASADVADRAAPDAAPPASAAPAPAAASAPSVATLKAQNAPAPSLETSSSPPKSVAVVSRPTESAPTARHAWAVQLGSFASKTNAERLVHQMQASGGSFYVVSGGSGQSVRYRVRMGPLADRSAAERAVGKLKAQGHPATVVTPAS
jgi:DedD protein